MFSLALASVCFNIRFALRFAPTKGRQQEKKSGTRAPEDGAPFEVRAGNQSRRPHPREAPRFPSSALSSGVWGRCARGTGCGGSASSLLPTQTPRPRLIFFFLLKGRDTESRLMTGGREDSPRRRGRGASSRVGSAGTSKVAPRGLPVSAETPAQLFDFAPRLHAAVLFL